MQSIALNFNQYFLKIFGNSQRRVFSTMLYGHTLLFSDQDHYKGEAGKNWMFLRFQAALELDPKFYEAALYGGLYTSIIKDDPIYGNKLYTRGLEYYPLDFKLNYNIGFNYLFDLKDPKNALLHYQKIIGTEEQIRIAPLLTLQVAKLIDYSDGHESKNYILKTLRGTIDSLYHAPRIKKALLNKLKKIEEY